MQRQAGSEAAQDPQAVHTAAAQGIATSSSQLPHFNAIQQAFGRHDISGIRAHTGADAAASAGAMGARAYATGDHVVLGRGTDLHTVAHEVAHVVQQRAGVHLSGGVGRAGDPYERHADAVADLVVQGKSAESLLDTHAPAGGGGAAPPGAVQHKLEYATHHAIAPDAANKAVKADQAGYDREAEQFELKLGIGLHGNALAHEGADAMLQGMQQAMTRAGIDDAAQDEAFGSKASAKPDLGAVLVKDVRAALGGGNLREKMGMVYQARFKIAEALNTLREMPEAHDMLGDELTSPAMDAAVKANGTRPVAHAILERRNSVKTQPRIGNTAAQPELTEGQLDADGIGLSDREKDAATPGPGGRAFVPGRQVYVIPPDARKAEQDNLRRVAAGLSGSADMYFHIANHLKMPENERKKLRLASLGQMLANRDHSYHEIMHEARTQGGLTDYSDQLPLGYTQLAPLQPDDILATANATEFPGDAQIRAISGPMETSASISAAAAPGPKSNSYPAVLAQLRAYERSPSQAKLQAAVDGIKKWLKAEQPGRFATDATRAKYTARAPRLEGVLAKAEHLLAMKDGLDAKPTGERATAAGAVIATGGPAQAFMDSLADLDGDHEDWYSPEFRAQTSDLALNTANTITIPANPDPRQLGTTAELSSNLGDETTKSVGESAWELEGVTGSNKGVPETLPAGFGNRLKSSTVNTAKANKTLHTNKEDFDKFDSEDLQALQPSAPLGGILKRFEGKPVPAELHALNAYTQDGFYKMMNYVLNRRANKRFMATPEGQQWWSDVPDDAKKLISLAVSGVRKMKPYTGDLYRGENLVSTKLVQDTLKNEPNKANRENIWRSKIAGPQLYNQFVSTSKQPHSSYIVKAGTYTAERITKTKTAVDISALGGKLYEREVVFAPGTKFKLVSVEDRFDTSPGSPDRYGNDAHETPIASTEQGRIKVTFEEE